MGKRERQKIEALRGKVNENHERLVRQESAIEQFKLVHEDKVDSVARRLENRVNNLIKRVKELEHPKDVKGPDVEAHGNTWESMYHEGPARINFVVDGEEVDVLGYLRNLTDRMETLEAAMFDLEDTAYSDGWEGWGATMNNHEEILQALIDEAEGCTDPKCYLASPHQGECQPYVADNPDCVDYPNCIRHTDPDGHHLGKHRIWGEAHGMYIDVPTTQEIADSAITTEDLASSGCPDCEAGIPKARGTTEYRYGWDANGMITFEEVPADKAGGPPTKTPGNTIPDAYTLLRNYVNDLYDRIEQRLHALEQTPTPHNHPTSNDHKILESLENHLAMIEDIYTRTDNQDVTLANHDYEIDAQDNRIELNTTENSHTQQRLNDAWTNILDLLERITTLETQQPNQPHIPPYTPTYPPPNTYPNPYQPPNGTGNPPPNTWYQTYNSTEPSNTDTWPPQKETK